MTASPYAAGSLVRARGRDWVVLPESDSELLHVRPLGGTDVESTALLLALEGPDVHEATVALPDPDRPGDARSVRLLQDALRLGIRSSAGPFRSFGRIAVDPRPYQLVPLLMALKQDTVRLLIADDVGIGKTVESLLIARELLDQGTVARMTVLCSPQLAEQWQREMRDKFHLDAALVLPSTVSRLERRLGIGQSLFDVHPHTVVSTDYIKSERRREDFLRAAPELIIVDEAHTCVDSGGVAGRGSHQRHDLLRGLAEDTSRHLILVTATPHSGKEEGFRNLLALLDESVADLPDDLAGAAHEEDRRHLAAYFIQRRRRDIRDYLDEETTFPRRETAEETYRLSPAYRALLERCLDLARESVLDADGGAHRQRVRWWSALALLRSVASSPAAAAQTLRNRAAAADTDTVREADEIGRRTVLDMGDDESLESIDVPPGSDIAEKDDDQDRTRRRLLALAREADALVGDQDAKLKTAVTMVERLLKDGFNPIVFCRFIPTAEYVAAALRDTLPSKVEVVAVTGQLPPSEREARVQAMAAHKGRRVLVATDCMSEGINLQQSFDAVVHYDLSWNPTRHEQREGRVDRFGQPSKVVRTVTYWGDDTMIDGLVLEVLIRKHEQIRKDLGISVPVPIDSNKIVEALMEGLLMRGQDADQLQLDLMIDGEQRELFAEWDDVAAREKRSQTMFAQRRIRPEEVRPHLDAVRDAIGSPDRVEVLVREVADVAGATLAEQGDTVTIRWDEANRGVQDVVREDATTARFDLPVEDGVTYLSRTDPLVERLATYVLDTALDEQSASLAARCGAMRTAAVTRRTTLLLLRFRFHLVITEDGVERPLLAEDARLVGFEGIFADPTWLSDDAVQACAAARPDANISTAQAADFVRPVVDGFGALRGHLDDVARDLGERLERQHGEVRSAARQDRVSLRVEPHLPADVIGIWVLLPTGGGAS